MKIPFIIYADMGSLLEIIGICHNNPEKSSTTKINKHTASGYSLFTYCSFDVTRNKHDYYRGKDCMKNLCKYLREHATKIIDCEKKQKIPLTNEENQSYHGQTFVIYGKKNLVLMIKKNIKSEIIAITLEDIETLFIMFVI